MDGTGITGSISGAARFAWKYPSLLLPAYALQKAGEHLIDLSTSSFIVVGPTPTAISMEPGWFPAVLVGAAVQGFLYMFFMVVYFAIYRMKKAPPDAPLGPAQDAKE
jgi:hypothetical protein